MGEGNLASGTAAPEARPAGRWRRARDWTARTWRRAHPSAPVRRAAVAGLLALLAVVAAVAGGGLHIGFGRADLPLGVLAGLVIAGLLGLAAWLGARLLFAVQGFLGWIGLAALAAVGLVLAMLDVPLPLALLAGVALGLGEAFFAGALAVALGPRWRESRAAKRVAVAAIAAAGLAGNAALVWYLAQPGSDAHLVRPALAAAGVAPLDAPDPGAPGSYRVLTLTYGSRDVRRREFGAGAALVTEPVDAAPFVKGNEGFKMKVRRWFWGFDPSRFPRNGRVWYPDGAGPFPLVLVVHGNHGMAEYSDPGYAYLCGHLASHGFIAVSVDENFFNGYWAGGLENENDGRAFLLLAHLALWREWSAASGNPFAGKVDMSRIALVGHSRGGEAAAIAGALNRLSRYPDDATVALPHGFAIRSIVAIAPSDGQYSPAGRPTPLEDVNYLLLQGGHDADVSFFMGERQFERLRFTPDGPWFKAYVWAYRANHGQFNTVWGADDAGWPLSLLLDHRPLLSGEEQRRLGKVLVTAFLEATLEGRSEYAGLFRDLRRGRAWLPDDAYLTRYADATFEAVATYDEDVDVTTATLPGATIAGTGLAVWREQRLPWRKGDTKQVSVAYVGWREAAPGEARPAGPPAYAISLPAGTAVGGRLGAGSALVFSAAAADEKPPEPKQEPGKPASAKPAAKPEPAHDAVGGKNPKPIDFTVEVVDANGTAARLPLSRFRPLLPPLASRFTKLPDESDLYGKATEPVLQSFELPLADFAAAAPGFDAASVRAICFVFDRTPRGVVVLGDIGFAGAEPRAGGGR
ncbi:MAG TPA: hypothetical protein VLW17_09030 [Thermoanaerobaculaceae bacterium]|nr:hypothetical protein [Thermoanaerobaculaceae bacterium]